MTVLFSFPEQVALADSLNFNKGEWEWRHFPDGESYVRVISDVKNKPVIILCSLNAPDAKALPLIFLARTLKELGAAKITLAAPYLSYMRQDKRFHPGEAVTSEIFAELISPLIDALITIDPHLHRHHRLEEIYDCEGIALSTAPLMAEWVAKHIKYPLIIGPDSESEQWVKVVAEDAAAPYIVLEKIRHGDRDVEIMLPDIAQYHSRTPVLVDDIISSGATILKTAKLLKQQGFKTITCLATHGLFAGKAYENLQQADVRVITCNTIPHPSNGLDVAPLIKTAIHQLSD